MQAAMEMLVWPDGVSRPEFRTVNEGKTMGEKWNRKRGATSSFELWASLFADDCAVFFNSREELVIGNLFTHLRIFGLEMHVGREGRQRQKKKPCFARDHVGRMRTETLSDSLLTAMVSSSSRESLNIRFDL